MRWQRNIQTHGNLDVIWDYSNMSVVSAFWNMLVWSFTTKTGLVALSSAVAVMGALIVWAQRTFVPEIEKSNFLDLRFLNAIPIPKGEDRPTDLIDTPPFPKEIQAISSMEIIKQYKLPIDKLVRESSLSESEINLYLLPAIEKLVHIVHLLPASHEDHHSYEGGLLTHSLETATNAVIAAQNHIFDAGEMPGQKYQNKQRWILAAAIAGLAHDLGKVIRDIRVVDADTHRVKRMDVPMKNWIRRYQVRAYSINWTGDDRTPKSHQGDSHFMLRSLLSDSIVNYLCYEGSSTIYKALRDSVYDMSSGPLGKLLQEADIRSSSDDQVHRAQLSANNQIIQTSNASQICHAIQMMLTTGKWSYNKPDSRVFVTREGCFLLWSEDATGRNITAQEISETSREIAKDTHTSYVQRSKTVMYENLLHGRVLLPKDKDGDYLWTVCPIVTKNKYLLCLRFHNAQHLFGFDMVPNMIDAHVEGTEANLRQRTAWTKEYGVIPETFNPLKATQPSSFKASTLEDLINGMEIEKKDEAIDEMRLVLEKYMKREIVVPDFIPEGQENLPREANTTETVVNMGNDEEEEPQNVVEYASDVEDQSEDEDSEDADESVLNNVHSDDENSQRLTECEGESEEEVRANARNRILRFSSEKSFMEEKTSTLEEATQILSDKPSENHQPSHKPEDNVSARSKKLTMADYRDIVEELRVALKSRQGIILGAIVPDENGVMPEEVSLASFYREADRRGLVRVTLDSILKGSGIDYNANSQTVRLS